MIHNEHIKRPKHTLIIILSMACMITNGWAAFKGFPFGQNNINNQMNAIEKLTIIHIGLGLLIGCSSSVNLTTRLQESSV